MPSSSKLRVLLLDPAGSSCQVTHNLANHLSQRGCDVQVYTAPYWLRATDGCSTTYGVQAIFYRGTQFRSYEAKTMVARLGWRALRLVQHVWALGIVWKDARRFDVVHTQILSVPPLDYLCLRAIGRRTPVVCTVHELVPHSARFRRWNSMVFRAVYRKAARLFAFTECTRRKLVHDFGVPAGKVLMIPHGSLEHLLGLRKEAASAEHASAPIIHFIGGIRRDKGLEVLIEAAGHLKRRGLRFKIQIAGAPGFDLSEIRNLVGELGLEEVVDFRLGYLPESEFADCLSRATIVALPYRRIEQSGVAIAACTFGKAIVATRCGGVEELVTEAQNGVLVPIDDAAAFGEALASLLLDDEKRKLCELHSRQYAREVLSWDAIAAKTISAYRDVTQQRTTEAGLSAREAAERYLRKPVAVDQTPKS